MEIQPNLIVVCGWPASGKTTIAELLGATLELRVLDIDSNVRYPIFGAPHPHPDSSPELRKKDIEEMAASYELLITAAGTYLKLHRSLIITATFSRKKGQEDLIALCQKYLDVKLSVIWCIPQNDNPQEIEHRLRLRVEGGNYFGAVNSLPRYNEVKNRYEPILLPHLQINTSSPETPKSLLPSILEYINR